MIGLNLHYMVNVFKSKNMHSELSSIANHIRFLKMMHTTLKIHV